MRNARTVALLLTVAVAFTAVLLLAPAGAAQGDETQDPDVPVPYTSSNIGEVPLYFWVSDYGTGDCDPHTEEPGDLGEHTPFCSARLERPQASSGAAERESYAVGGEDGERESARFVMDTQAAHPDDVSGDADIRGQGAYFPFTIRAGNNAIVYDFAYNANMGCSSTTGQPLQFTMRLVRADGATSPGHEGGISNENVIQRSSATYEACGHSGTGTQTGSNRVTVGVDLDQPIHVDEGETLVVEIFADTEDGISAPSEWTLLFQREGYASGVQLRTSDVVERAIWAADDTGTHQTVFDPNAPQDERLLTGYTALRSPFGPVALDDVDLSGTVENPDGVPMNLHPDHEDQSQLSVSYESVDVEEPHDGAKQVYRFSEIDDQLVWSYDPEQEDFLQGPHTVTSYGTVTFGDQSRSLDYGTTVSMGEFPFILEMFPQDSSTHSMVAGTSTTFLVTLENQGPADETFQLDTEFRFSEGGAAWSVDVRGVNSDDQITLGPEESAILRVTVTPPSEATVGDAARVALDAESIASGNVETQTLEASITDRTTRDVDVIVLRDDPYQVGVDRTSQIDVFLWNKGTAVDSLRASFVEGSFDPDDPDIFDASFPQRTFDNVAPGDFARVPVDVTTTSQVEAGDQLVFSVEGASVNDPDATGQEEVTTVVDAVREFSVTGLIGDNDKATSSVRFGKYNISDAHPEAPSGYYCENAPPGGSAPSEDYQRDCLDHSNYTYHVFELENRGDLVETFELSTFGDSYVYSTSDCAGAIQDRLDLDDGVALVESMNVDDPGSEETIDQLTVAPGETKPFFLRLEYDGYEAFWETVDSGTRLTSSPCSWDGHETNIRVSIADAGISSTLPAETRIYAEHPSEDMPSEAQARLAMQDRFQRGDTLTQLPSHFPVEPGQTSTINFTVSLQAGHYDPVVLDTIAGADELREDGWEIELVPVDATGTEHGEGLLFPSGAQGAHFEEITGAHLTAALQVTVPEEGLQEGQRETVTLQASSDFASTVTDNMQIGLQVGSEFAFDASPVPETGELSAVQGGQVAFAVDIANTGASRDTYHIEATGSPATYDDVTVQPSSVSISPGTSKTVSVLVDVPPGADAPAAIETVVTADAGNPNEEPILEETLQLSVDVEAQGTLSLDGPEEEATLGPGGETALSFTIVNDANQEREVQLSELVAPEGFETTLSQGPQTITVDADDEETFTYLVEAPEDILEGSVFPFTLRAEDTEASELEDAATGVGFAGVIGETMVDVVVEEGDLVVQRGQNETFTLRVENPGSTPAVFNLDASFETSGWSATVRDEDGDRLLGDAVEVPERSFERVLLEVRAPDEVPEGHVESIVFSATAEGDRETTASTTLEAAIHDHAVSLILEGARSQDAAPAQNVEYRVTIVNEGNGDDQIELSFEGPETSDPPWETTSQLEADTTPVLEPGERLENVTVLVQTPGPDQRPVPVDGEATVIRATSAGASPTGGSPTDTVTVETNLVRYQPLDLNDDGVLEMAVDFNRDASDGFEAFYDPTAVLIERGEADEDAVSAVEGVAAVDADGDQRVEHIVDTTGDGIGDAFFDPDRAQRNTIPYTADMDGDGQPDYPLDTEFDGRLDAAYVAGAENVYSAEDVDLTEDGYRELLADTNGDTFYDTFVNPQEEPPLVTDVARDGDVYKVDTDGDGNVDTHYDAETQSVSDARAANLGDFVTTYWWFLLVFLAVLVAFGLIVYRRV